jgi:hypothetical protein
MAKRPSIGVLLMATAVLLTGCLEPPQDINNASVARYDGKPFTLDEMEQAIRRAAFMEGWQQLDLMAPGHFVVTKHQDEGEWSATVDIFYTTSDFSIRYKDSKGLVNYSAGVISHQYPSMVEDLYGRIRKLLRELPPADSQARKP